MWPKIAEVRWRDLLTYIYTFLGDLKTLKLLLVAHPDDELKQFFIYVNYDTPADDASPLD